VRRFRHSPGRQARRVKFSVPAADNPCMKPRTPSPWAVMKNGDEIDIVGRDSSRVAQLPASDADRRLRVADAYLIAAAPLLLEACKNLNAVLENNLVVTAEGYKINDAHLRESLLDAILRAEGYRRNPDPQ